MDFSVPDLRVKHETNCFQPVAIGVILQPDGKLISRITLGE